MKALRIEGPGAVALCDVPLPVARENEVLVRVARTGLCATDRRLAARDLAQPRIPGHEISGWSSDGRGVGVHPDIGCGTCPACQDGFENRCARRVSIGIDRDGGLAEWLAVPRGHVLDLDGLDPGEAVLLEPLACCLHAVARLGVERGMATVVVGAGPMGMLATWALQPRGALFVFCQRLAARRREADALGADAVIGPEEDLMGVFGQPPVAAIVTAPGPEALGWAVERVAVGGRVHAFAGSVGASEIDANRVHYRHLTLVGSTGSTMQDFREAHALAVSGAVDLRRLPLDTLTLAQAATALTSPGAPRYKSVVDIGRP
ncbi:zinc-dependent dehydrogenase [soil metagenome]